MKKAANVKKKIRQDEPDGCNVTRLSLNWHLPQSV